MHSLKATVIVPFHRNLGQLRGCLAALSPALPDVELIVAADGAVEDCTAVARAHGASVIVLAERSGPAAARNRAAARARGELLVFVDADVVAAPGAVQGMCDCLDRQPAIAGVFGAYDRTPAAANFVSQFKNLSHAYVHEVGNPRAGTFWAGLGAVRAEAFAAVGGFDERFVRPSVEDIDLGYRLVEAGFALRLDPAFRGTHLKRWTFWNCVVTDIRARGIPWTQLILRYKALSNDLNTSRSLRASVALSYGILAGLVLMPLSVWAGAGAAVLLAMLLLLNASYYQWLARQRGWLFALRVVPLHLVHHLCNGVSFVAGTALHLARRSGVALPGALPSGPWAAAPARAASGPRVAR